jgi:hypothetical protein
MTDDRRLKHCSTEYHSSGMFVWEPHFYCFCFPLES